MPVVPELEPASEPVLAVLDRAVLLLFPCLVVAAMVIRPEVAPMWMFVAGSGLVLFGAMALLGRAGRARWRGTGYASVALVASIVALWTIGPLTGVGIMFGLATLFAGAFLRPGQLVAVVVIGAVAILCRAAWGGAMGIPVVGGRYEVPPSLWFGITLASAVMLWIAMRVLTELVSSLEQAYIRAADAYHRETTTREELDSSRHDLEELAQVELIGRLAGGVAHDINNALSPILFASESLADEVTTPDQRRHLAELEAASHHVADLVRDLLWIGRRFPVSTRPVAQLGETVRACVERIERVARKLVIDVGVERDLQLAISPEHLEQILFRLVLGAHRSGASRIALTSKLAGPGVILAVQPLERSERTPERSPAMRCKLGLSAAHELVGQSDGTMTVADDGTVLIELPVVRGSVRAFGITLPALPTALVVEDEPMVLRRLCQLVARRGYTVRAASSVAEAMAALAAKPAPDLLVTDLQLPDGSGEEVALAFYANGPTRPIIVCSGFSASELDCERMPLAPITFLAKPFRSSDLEAAIPVPRECAA